MPDKSDLLVLGATGHTGRLITRYLSHHPHRNSFTLAVGARSPTKLQKVLEEDNLRDDSSIRIVQVDVTKEAEVENAVKSTRVVINTVGPFWRWATPVVRACAKYGIHYVDVTGETVWIRHIILHYDFAATKTGAIIVPSCGFDSIPSDLSAYLSNKTLKSLQTPLDAGTSTSAFKLRSGMSGGTFSTIMMMLEDVPKKVLKESGAEYSLSPVIGPKPPRVSLYYSLPIPGARPLIGSFFFMGPGNKAIVQRTFGLLELEARTSNSKEAKLARYGPGFTYSEFLVMPSVFRAVSFSFILMTGFLLVAFVKPVRWLVKKIMPQPGEGPSEEDRNNGFVVVTNVTKSTSQPPVHVKSVFKGKGDGYLLTSIMVSECALSLIIPPNSSSRSPEAARAALPLLARRGGGILTPMTAFGDVLVRRLEGTGHFEFSSSVVGGDMKKRD